MAEHKKPQLDLDVAIYPEAHISDFIGDEWVSVIDAVRQMSMGLLSNCFFHGHPESGKSHLLIAMCTLYRDMDKKAIYLPMQDLINQSPDILDDIEENHLVAIDDLHLISHSLVWQEAVFHLFNESVTGECQLALVANRPVIELDLQVKDLVSRLAQCASFALPKIQLVDDRKETLKNIIGRRNLAFNSNIISHLANHGPSKTSLMIAVVDELQSLSPDIGHKKLKKDIRARAIQIIERYAELDK